MKYEGIEFLPSPSCCRHPGACSPAASAQSLGLGSEAAIDFFRNYLYITPSIQINKNIDFCQRLLHKLKQPQELHCFPRWGRHLIVHAESARFNYSCNWKHLIMSLLKNQHLPVSDPKFPSPFLNQCCWQKYSWFSPWVLILIWIKCWCLRRSWMWRMKISTR